ncbi:sensor domain-containing diguanylate cyclase [Lachnospiraceae bacterium 46-61]
MREVKGIKKERRKLYIQLVIAFIIFFTAASTLFLHFRKELRQGELERCYIELKMFSEQSSQMIEVILNDSLKDVENMTVDMMLTEEWDITKIEKQLKEKAKNIIFCYIGIADKTGFTQTTTDTQINIKNEEFFKQAMNGISTTSNLITNPLKYSNEFVNAAPIYKNNEIVGVLYGAIDVDSFSESVRSIIENEEYYFSIVEQNGNFILNPKKETPIISQENFEIDISQTNLLENDIDHIKINMGQNENEIMSYILQGEQRYLYYTPYKKNNWYTISIMNPQVMNRKLHNINIMVGRLSIEILVIFAAIFLWIFYLSKKSRDEMIQMNQILKQNETSFAIAVSQGVQVVFDYDIETKQLTFRYKGNEKYGFPRQLESVPESLIQKGWVVSSYIEDVRNVFEKIEEGQQTASCVVKLIKPDGNFAWSKIIITNIFDQQRSNIIQTVGILEDATQLKENTIRIAEEMELRKAITSNAIASYEINVTRDYIEEQNFDNMEERKETEKRKIYSKFLYEVIQFNIYENDRLSVLTTFSRENLFYIFYRGKRALHLEYRKKVNEEYIWVETTIHFLQEPESGDIKGLMVVKDINDKKGKEMELKKQADIDFLTEVYNRATTERLVSEVLALKVIDGKGVHAFLICDLDNFKTVNDTLGHKIGDKVLVDAAHILKKHFRQTDIIGRLGGDEFIVLIQNINSFSAIKSTVGRLVKEFDKTYGEGDKTVRITVSIGISLSPLQGGDFLTLYEKADKALYKVKENGRNGFAIFEEEK